MITKLITLQSQLRVWHWQTTSYAKHQAFGQTYSKLDELIDEFVEVFQGKYAKIKSEKTFNIQLENLVDTKINAFIDDNIKFLMSVDKEYFLSDVDNEELLNIRDEIISELQKLKYLLTLD